jgi:hypothetical protein
VPRRKADEFYADAPDDSLFTFAAAWPEWPKVTPKGLTTPYAKLIAWLTRNCQGDWCAAKHKRILCVVGLELQTDYDVAKAFLTPNMPWARISPKSKHPGFQVAIDGALYRCL